MKQATAVRAFLMGLTYFVLSLAMTVAWVPARAAADISKGPAADWIDIVDVPAADPKLDAQIRNGISQLLLDHQIRQIPDGYETFDRYSYKIVDRSGLEAGATISFEFDPATSSVTMNRLRIIRDGVVIDQLSEASFDVFRREKDAEKGLFDGWLTAYVNLEDVRVGDIVDYARTIVSKPIIGPHLFYDYISTVYDEPVAVNREKIIWPTAQPLAIRQIRTDIKPAVSEQGSNTVYQWQINDPLPIRDEDNLPPDTYGNPTIEISSAPDWQMIIDPLLPYYSLDQALPASFQAKVDEIATKYSNPLDRMIELTRTVQDDIRYVSLSIGRGSYIPRSPAAVIASGFGDCKDKALLLAIGLKKLGVDAEVALTDSDNGELLGSILPAMRAFDHVVVKASVAGKTYWLDATNYLQGGRADIVPPDDGFALPVVHNTRMERIERIELMQPTTSVTEQFEFPIRKGDPLKLNVETKYLALDADSIRYKFASQSIAKIADDYLRYYARSYPGIASTALPKVADDRDANVVTVIETYELSSENLYSDDLIKDFPLNADVGVSSLPEPDIIGRTLPIWLGSPMFKHYRAVVKNLKAKFVGPDDNKDVVTPYVAFKARWSSDGSEFQADWYLKTLATRIQAKDAARYLKARKAIVANSGWSFNFGYADTEAN